LPLPDSLLSWLLPFRLLAWEPLPTADKRMTDQVPAVNIQLLACRPGFSAGAGLRLDMPDSQGWQWISTLATDSA